MSEYDILTNSGRYKAHLDDIGVMTLPDQPGKRGYSAEEVKLHFKAPIDYLFALMKKGFTETQGYFDGYDVTFDWISKEITRLSEGIDGKGALFVPALQASPPDPNKVKVWLDDTYSDAGEIPKEEEADTQSLSFSEAVAEEEPETLEFDPDTSTLTFGDGTEISQEDESISFDSEGGGDEVSFAEESDESDESLTFGDGDAEDLTFGEE